MNIQFVLLQCYLLYFANMSLAVLIVKMDHNKVFVLDKFLVPCSTKQATMIRYENLTMIRNNQFFNYDLAVNSKLNSIFVSFTVTKCASREALDTCLPINTFKLPNACSLLSEQLNIWSPMMFCAEPKITCPMEGVYYGRNCTLNLESLRQFPLDGSYWKIRFSVFSQKKEVYCSLSDGSIRKY